MMKKLIYLLTLVAFMGISANTFADNTGTTPEIGSTHNYKITNTDGGDITWFVTLNATDLETADILNVEDNGVTVVTATTTDANNVDLTWVAPTSGKTYFVHVIQTVDGCSNHKVMAVTPTSAFNMDVFASNVGGDKIDPIVECAPAVTVTGWTVDQNFNYYYGQNTFYYKISATGIGANTWSPTFNIVGSATDASYVFTYTTSVKTAAVGLNTGDNTITDLAADEIVYVKVIVTNGEGVTVNNDVTLTLSTESTDQYGNKVSSPITTPTSTQTVKARPATSVIATDN